jgi:integrase
MAWAPSGNTKHTCTWNRAADGHASARRSGKDQLVFPNKARTPYNRGRVVKKVLHSILDKLGVERKGRRIGLHAFRHSVASMLLRTTGAAVAKRQLRHAGAALTLEVYGHVLGSDHTAAMDKIESVLVLPSGS